MKIQDGKGSGRQAEVNENFELVVKAFTQSVLHQASEDTGKAFYFSSQGFIPITSTATEKAVFFLKNNEARALVITGIRYGGDQFQKWRFYKNPISMSNPTAKSPVSLNFQSSTAFDGDCQNGGESSAFNGGAVVSQWMNSPGKDEVGAQNALILGNGDSLGLSVELAVAGEVGITIFGYLAEFS